MSDKTTFPRELSGLNKKTASLTLTEGPLTHNTLEEFSHHDVDISHLQEALDYSEERYRHQSERMIELENALRQDIAALALELKETKSKKKSEEIARKEAQANHQKLIREKKVWYMYPL